MFKDASKNHKNLLFYTLMLILPLSQFLIFYVYVNFNSFLLAFKTYDISTSGGFGGFKYSGLSTIKELFNSFGTNPYLPLAFKNSFIAYGINLFISTPLSILFSYYIYKKLRLAGVFRIILFLPTIIPIVVMGTIFTQVGETIIPRIARELGFQTAGLLSNEETVFGTLVFFTIYTSFSASTLLFVGTMTGISQSVTEAAKLDGVSLIQELVFITFPMIYATFSTILIVGITSIFTNQWNAFVFFSDKATGKAYTVGYYIFVSSTDAYRSRYPSIAALGILLTLIAVPMTYIVRRALTRYGEKYA